MSAHTQEALGRQKRIYAAVGAALIVGTVVTVLAASVHFGIMAGIIVALMIAAVKGSLVAGHFMHLFNERKLIYALLGFTAFFVTAMLVLIACAYANHQGRKPGIYNVPAGHVQLHHGAGHGE